MILIGKIVKTRGIKGEVVLAPSPYIDQFIPKKGDNLFLKSNKYQRDSIVDYYKEISGACVLKFQHTSSINDALKLVGYSVFNPSETKEPEENFISFTVKDVDGLPWGIVKSFQSVGISQLLEVEDPDGDIIYVPFSDEIIKSIDIEKRLVLIDPPRGLKELNK